MNHKELKAKIKEWIGEADFDILQEVKSEKTHFILTVKSKEKSVLNFPINVALSKEPKGLILGFTGEIKGEDNKSYRGTDKKYREKMVEELATRADLAYLQLSYSSNSEKTRFRGMKVILPKEITKKTFCTAITDLTEYRKYLDQIRKKYKFARPNVDNYSI